MAVIVTGHLDDLRAAGHAARQPHRRHGCLGTGGNEPDLINRGERAGDQLRDLDFTDRWCPEARAEVERAGCRRSHCGVRVAEDHGAPRSNVVDVGVAVDVVRQGTRRLLAIKREARRRRHRRPARGC